jgi:peroxiredoxin
MYRHTLFALLLISPLILCAQEEREVTLIATVEDATIDTLAIANIHSRIERYPLLVPVNEQGIGEVTFTEKGIKTYELANWKDIKNNGWYSVYFMTDADTIHLSLLEKMQYTVQPRTGGEENKILMAFEQEMFEEVLPPIIQAYEENESEYNGQYAIDSILYTNYHRLIREQPSIHSLFRLLYELDPIYSAHQDSIIENRSLALRFRLIKESFILIQPSFPDHPYTGLIENQIDLIDVAAEKPTYKNVTAETLNGEKVQLADYVEGTVTILSLWGSWCGPCIRKINELRPTFEAYREQGVQMIGIAREYGDTNALQKAIERQNYNWVNLVELDDRYNVWANYGISNGAGIIYVLDKSGIIRATNPEPRELDALLSQLVKE